MVKASIFISLVQKKGYYTVFLDYNYSSSVLLPYVTNRQNYITGLHIEANKNYIIFENIKSYFDNTKTLVDELEWETRENLEKMTIIFSTQPFKITELNQSYQKYLSSTYNMPYSLPSEDFDKWLISLQSKKKRYRNHENLS
jgi:hypothetical protein